MTYQIGDVVRHFYGGCQMTVIQVNSNVVETAWFDTNKQHHRDTFKQAELVFLWH